MNRDAAAKWRDHLESLSLLYNKNDKSIILGIILNLSSTAARTHDQKNTVIKAKVTRPNAGSLFLRFSISLTPLHLFKFFPKVVAPVSWMLLYWIEPNPNPKCRSAPVPKLWLLVRSLKAASGTLTSISSSNDHVNGHLAFCMQNIFFTRGGYLIDLWVADRQTDGQTDRHFFSWGSGIFVCEIFY